MLALSTTVALAQVGSAPGATIPEKSGAAVNSGSAVFGANNGITTPSAGTTGMKREGAVGIGRP
jgi:hypothetical protein